MRILTLIVFRLTSSLLAASLATLLSASWTYAEPPLLDWPCWRGSRGDGVADGRDLPIRWSQTQNVRWSVKLPGWGTSSPVVFGERVFVTTHVKDQKSLLTLCFDRRTGKELWRHDFGFGADQRTHEKSNLAVNTPAVTRDAVYVAFGNAVSVRPIPFLTAMLQCPPKGGHSHGPRQTARSAQGATLATLASPLAAQRPDRPRLL